MSTPAQASRYQQHKRVCARLKIPQSLFKHRGLAGTVSAASPTGNTRLTGPGARVGLEVTTDVLVWAVWRQMERAAGPGDETKIGRISDERMVVQFPAVDDNGGIITVTHNDWLQISGGMIMMLESPSLAPDGSFWLATMERQR